MARGRAADGADAHCNRSQTEAATAPSDDGRASEDVRHDRPEGRSLTQTEGASTRRDEESPSWSATHGTYRAQP